MGIRRYFPSAQFTLMVVSFGLSIGLVFGAEYITKPTQPSTLVAATTPSNSTASVNNSNWEATLYQIQAQEGTSSLPTPPNQAVVGALLKAAQTNNVTDSIGRTLLVSLANANAQGLGSDIPTQTQLINQALGQIQPATSTKTYTTSDLTIVDDSPAAERAYGNAVAALIAEHTDNDVNETLIIVAQAIDANDPNKLKSLGVYEADYHSLAANFAAIPVPQTIAPLHLQIINDFEQAADTYPDIEASVNDPLRGLSGLQKFQSLTSESGRLFINIAQILNGDGILFSKDEPGASLWSALLSVQP